MIEEKPNYMEKKKKVFESFAYGFSLNKRFFIYYKYLNQRGRKNSYFSPFLLQNNKKSNFENLR